MRTLFNYVTGAAVAVVLTSGTAAASSVLLEYSGTPQGFRTVQIQDTPTGITPVASSVSAGAFYMTDTTGMLGKFVAWCLDITTYTSSGTEGYTVTKTPFSKYPLDSNDLGRVQAFFDANYDTALENRNKSAAFQVGLWEVLYDDDFSLTASASDSFRASSSTSAVNSYATDFLNAAQSYLTGGGAKKWNLTFLENDAGNRQNLVTVAPVPVPAAAVLLLGGLAGLGFASRRRRRTS